MVNDVRRACFNALKTRDFFMELHEEDPDHGSVLIGKLNLCLSVTRDAALNWQETQSRYLEDVGFTRGLGHLAVLASAAPDATDCARR